MNINSHYLSQLLLFDPEDYMKLEFEEQEQKFNKLKELLNSKKEFQIEILEKSIRGSKYEIRG